MFFLCTAVLLSIGAHYGDASRCGSRIRSSLKQHFSIYHCIFNPLGQRAHPPSVVREIMHDFLVPRTHRLRIKNHDVRSQARPRHPPIIDPVN